MMIMTITEIWEAKDGGSSREIYLQQVLENQSN